MSGAEKKILMKRMGPFPVVHAIGNNASEVFLPLEINMHSFYNVKVTNLVLKEI